MLSIIRLYHDLLGTYGDAGNAAVLVHRCDARGIPAVVLDIEPGMSVPTTGNIYLLGGGEDGPQTAALELLRADGGLTAAINQNGASLLAVCAGFQLIGESLPGAQGVVSGLGIIDVTTSYLDVPRSVGEVFARHSQNSELLLTGFENHQGWTQLGAGVAPLGEVVAGVGNGLPAQDLPGIRVEGALVDKVIGTYLHGPVLARNPELADQLIASQVGDLQEFSDEFAQNFASERRSKNISAN